MTINYTESVINTCDSYIQTKNLCVLILTSSILFYTMAKKHEYNIPKMYTLLISILLIVYAFILGVYSLYEFNHRINLIINSSKNSHFSNNLAYYNNVRYFYSLIGGFFIFIFTLIAYVLIRYDK